MATLGIKDEDEPLCHILTPVGMLGYGFNSALTENALKSLIHSKVPIALILDSGSTDSGPAKLALGTMTCPRSSYERDLKKLLTIVKTYGVKLLVSSAGGDGSDAHVDEFLDIIREICEEDGNDSYQFKTLSVYSNVAKGRVLESLQAGKVDGCGKSVPALKAEDVEDAVTIVAQMGPEPFIEAMEAQPDFDVLIGGRAYDPAPYVAYCIFQATRCLGGTLKSFTPEMLGCFTHMGKIMECGALCATPKSASAMATVYCDGTFDVKPLDEGARCTPSSVAAHTLYEKTRPDILSGPGGDLDLQNSVYPQLPDQRTVRVRGSVFKSCRDANLPYTVKLEAAKVVGQRTIFMGGIRDSILIRQIPTFQARVHDYVAAQNPILPGCTDFWKLGFHTYGTNGVMKAFEPGDLDYYPREIFLVGEVLASTQQLANAVASSARIALVHGAYPGQRATAGNLAMGIGGKMEIPMGPCAEFCIYHLMQLEAGEEGARMVGGIASLKHESTSTQPLFSWRVTTIGKGDDDASSSRPGPPSASSILPSSSARNPSFPSTLNLTTLTTLTDIAPIIRSKNASPYEITLDVVFSSHQIYNIIKSSPLLSSAVVAKLYHIREEEIIWCGYYDQALAWKCTIPRPGGRASGGWMENDVHASQQSAGLAALRLDEDVRERIRGLGLEAVKG